VPADDLFPRLVAAVKHSSVADAKLTCSKPAPEAFGAALCMLALARLGDLDAAYRNANQLYASRRGRTPAEDERLWMDDPNGFPLAFLTSHAAAPLRRDPRYIELAQRVGLLDYWRSGRPPDFCRVRPEPICARLLAKR
jgi:hypothetical protein